MLLAVVCVPPLPAPVFYVNLHEQNDLTQPYGNMAEGPGRLAVCGV